MNVARRLSFVLSAVILVAASVGAQQPPAGRGGRGDLGGPGSSGPGPLNAYAYAECGASNATAVHLVIVTGPVPAAVPASTPQPSVKLVFNVAADKLSESAQSLTVSADGVKGGPNAGAFSCPVVGDCVPAQSGTISVQRGADGAIFGNYQATWTGTPERRGRFTAVWRDSQKKCG